MKKMGILMVLGVLAACSGGDGESNVADAPSDNNLSSIDKEFALYLTDLSTRHIIPRYQALANSTSQFNTDTATFCSLATPAQADLELVHSAWKNVNTQWQSIQWLKVGPIITDNQILRIQFFPDDNNAVNGGVEDLLAVQQVITPEYIATQNVGGQGIPAAERLLYPEVETNSLLNAVNRDKRCEVLQAIAGNLDVIAQDLIFAWQVEGGNYIHQLTSGTGDFTSVKDAVEELITNWLEQLERAKDEKLLTPLGSAAPGFPQMAEQPYSDNSISSLQANISVFLTIYTADDGHGMDDILTNFLNANEVNTQMKQTIEEAINAVNTLNGSFTTMLNSEQGRAEILAVIDSLRALRDVLTVEFLQVTNLNLGFNSNDGD